MWLMGRGSGVPGKVPVAADSGKRTLAGWFWTLGHLGTDISVKITWRRYGARGTPRTKQLQSVWVR
jgi:hypothetical protein